MPEYLAITRSGTPYLTVFNSSDWDAVPGTPTLAGSGYAAAFSPDGSLLAIGYLNSPFLTVINTSGWSAVSGTPVLSGTCYSLSFSPSGSMLAVAGNALTSTQRVRVFDTSDWSAVLDDFDLNHNSARAVAFSPDGVYLAIGYNSGNRLIVLNTSGWSTVTGTPSIGSYIYSIAYSPDGSLMAVASDSSPYLTVIDTSNWSVISGTPTLAGTCYCVAFSPDGGHLAAGHSRSPYLTVLDTSDWSAVSGVESPGVTVRALGFSEDGGFMALGASSAPRLSVMDPADWSMIDDPPTSDSACYAVAFSPAFEESHILQLSGKLLEGVDWSYSPDLFEGLAVSHGGEVFNQGSRNATRLTVFNKLAGKYYAWNELDPVNTYHQTISFSPGGRLLLAGGDTPLDAAVSARANSKYPALDNGFWGYFTSGGVCLSLSWSDDGRYHVAHFYDTNSRVPVVMYWDGAAYAMVSPASLQTIRYYRRAELSPDGEFLIITANYSSAYDQSPYIWAFRNNRDEPDLTFTPVDVNLSGNSLLTSYGLQIAWSPDSAYFVVAKYVFKWNGTSQAFEIIASLTDGALLYKAAWSPDSAYLAVVTFGDNAYIYKREGDTFTQVETLSHNGTMTALCWSRCGNHLFIGTSPSSGGAFFMYDQDGDNFTLNTANDFSAIDSAVVSITTSPGPRVETVSPLITTHDISLKDHVIGRFYPAGHFAMIGRMMAGAELSLLASVGSLSMLSRLSPGGDPLLALDPGVLVLNYSLVGKYQYFKPEVRVDRFRLAENLLGFVLVDIDRAPFVEVYRCRLTGAADGLEDLELPIASFHSRLNSGLPTSLEVIVSGVRLHAGAVAARKSGDLVVSKGLRYPDGSAYYREIARVPFDVLSSIMGQQASQMTLSGFRTVTRANPKTVNLRGVSTVSMQDDEKRRVQCAVDFFARPGDVVAWDGGSMTAGQITVVVGRVSSAMYITEA